MSSYHLHCMFFLVYENKRKPSTMSKQCMHVIKIRAIFELESMCSVFNFVHYTSKALFPKNQKTSDCLVNGYK